MKALEDDGWYAREPPKHKPRLKAAQQRHRQKQLRTWLATKMPHRKQVGH